MDDYGYEGEDPN
jgi:hypothetical protein